MKVRVRHTAQLRAATGRHEEEIDLPEGSTLALLLAHLASTHAAAQPHLLTDEGLVRPSLLMVVNGTAIANSCAGVTPLGEGDEVTLLPPIAGG